MAVSFATLGMRPEVADWIGQQMQAGTVTTCTAILSHYFRHSDADSAEQVLGILERAGAKTAICRCHAKVILMQAGTNWLTVESSANLRSCRAIEQATVTNSQELYDFHAAWMRRILDHEIDIETPR
jgi:negative regulator of sigma E activity